MWMHGDRAGLWAGVPTSGRRVLERFAVAVLRRVGEAPGLDDDQRAWLLQDLGQALDAQIEDAKEGGVSRQAAQRMATIRATMLWLSGRGASPGAPAVEYLEQSLRSIDRRPTERELFQRNLYLAAIGELGGDVRSASQIWREPFDLGDPAGHGKVLAFQGRKLRSLMQERGMSIGELADRSEIDDIPLLVSLIFGLEEMRFEEAMRLAGALGVSPARFSEGVRFVPGHPDGTGVYEIDPEVDVPEEDAFPPRSDETGEGGAR